MYLAYWNLREPPFQNVADSRFAYLSAQHHEGLARLMYVVQNRKLGAVLTGPYGIGKSMVLELLAQHVRRENTSRYIGIDYLPGPCLGLARQILSLVGYDGPARELTDAMDAVRFLRQEQPNLSHTVLAVDEAQTIADSDTYHFLQLLMNIVLVDKQNRITGSAFTLLLAGYSDLTRLLARDESLCQRLQIVWNLEPLTAEQVVEYVQHRIRVAGGDIWLFDQHALAEVTTASRGIPRLINNICDVALMLGFASNQRQVDVNLMRQAIHDVRFTLATANAAPAPEKKGP